MKQTPENIPVNRLWFKYIYNEYKNNLLRSSPVFNKRALLVHYRRTRHRRVLRETTVVRQTHRLLHVVRTEWRHDIIITIIVIWLGSDTITNCFLCYIELMDADVFFVFVLEKINRIFYGTGRVQKSSLVKQGCVVRLLAKERLKLKIVVVVCVRCW